MPGGGLLLESLRSVSPRLADAIPPGLRAPVLALDPRGFELTPAAPLTSVTTALVVAVGYLTVAWVTTGRSYGGHVMGLRVVDRSDHRLLGLARALLRAVLCALFPIGILWCVGPAHRSVQDIATGSSVVYDWSPRGQRGQRGRRPE